MVEIKDRLKEALIKRDMTASDLAKKSGINKGSISKYLRGDILPKQSAIDAMARVLYVLPSWLMGYDVPMEAVLPFTISVNTYDDEKGSEDLPEILVEYEQLNTKEQEQVMNYIKFLKSQRGDKPWIHHDGTE